MIKYIKVVLVLIGCFVLLGNVEEKGNNKLVTKPDYFDVIGENDN
ncbi:hypothetical protein [Fundicoccus culcitae]|uniref:Uncharacterized protein n=1 Tax=Fundicoccus culcitae TaxID=2969821 RepID=A0ABY5P713_9LACT|nr:hypothetical protein [Fundicoccus culcitae]UUX34459.1 hypothetical protein NRE15_02075 [Fundicoccus culcitae]